MLVGKIMLILAYEYSIVTVVIILDYSRMYNVRSTGNMQLCTGPPSGGAVSIYWGNSSIRPARPGAWDAMRPASEDHRQLSPRLLSLLAPAIFPCYKYSRILPSYTVNLQRRLARSFGQTHRRRSHRSGPFSFAITPHHLKGPRAQGKRKRKKEPGSAEDRQTRPDVPDGKHIWSRSVAAVLACHVICRVMSVEVYQPAPGQEKGCLLVII